MCTICLSLPDQLYLASLERIASKDECQILHICFRALEIPFQVEYMADWVYDPVWVVESAAVGYTLSGGPIQLRY